MNKSLVTRNAFGIVVLGVGVLALLGAMGLFNFGDVIGRWWPLLVIFGGVMTFIGNPRQFVWPLAIVIIGVLFQLRQLDLVTFNVWQSFWPLIIISIGISILLGRASKQPRTNSADTTNISAYFSSNETRSDSRHYQGGAISTTFGGVELDLRDAVIKDSATLNVSVIFGGLELRVPREWRIQSNVVAIIGGVDGKSNNEPQPNAPTLIINGDVIFGGIDIKR